LKEEHSVKRQIAAKQPLSLMKPRSSHTWDIDEQAGRNLHRKARVKACVLQNTVETICCKDFAFDLSKYSSSLGTDSFPAQVTDDLV
jgi:hypothetical protein